MIHGIQSTVGALQRLFCTFIDYADSGKRPGRNLFHFVFASRFIDLFCLFSVSLCTGVLSVGGVKIRVEGLILGTLAVRGC